MFTESPLNLIYNFLSHYALPRIFFSAILSFSPFSDTPSGYAGVHISPHTYEENKKKMSTARYQMWMLQWLPLWLLSFKKILIKWYKNKVGKRRQQNNSDISVHITTFSMLNENIHMVNTNIILESCWKVSRKIKNTENILRYYIKYYQHKLELDVLKH